MSDTHHHPYATEDAYRLLVEGAQDYAIIMLDPQRRVAAWNSGAERILGFDPDEVLGRSADIFFTPEDRAQGAPEREADTALREGRAQDVRWHLRKDGTRFWADGMLRPLYDGETLRGFGKIFRDLTERKRLEEESERRMRDLGYVVSHARGLLWHGTVHDVGDADYFWWDTRVFDEAAAQAFLPLDLLPGERYTHAWYRHRLPEGKALTNSLSREALHDGVSVVDYRAEFGCRTQPGEVRWFSEEVFAEAVRPGVWRVVGVAIDITQRKQAEDELRARAERESLLNRIGQAVRTSLDTDVVQTRAMMVLGKGLNADRCYFQLFDAARDLIVVGRDWHRADLSPLAGEYPVSGFGVTLDQIYSAQQTLVIEDVRRGPFPPQTAAVMERLGHRAVINVPFFDKGELVAALVVAMADAPREWTPDEVTLVEAAATQIRAAVEAARILQREQNIVLSLQDALLPPVPHGMPGLELGWFYKAALAESKIGGDFCDVFSLGESRTALVIGDLSGKGLAAATQVATVRNMLRGLLYLEPTLTQAVTKLNAVLTEQNLLSGFVTLFVGAYDADTRTLTYVSGGHEPGLLRRSDGEVEELPPTGPILGAIEDGRYTDGQRTLAPGDSLVLYTDGLTEAGPTPREFLDVPGLARLVQELPVTNAPALVAQIIAGVQTHARGALRDDACLLVSIAQ